MFPASVGASLMEEMGFAAPSEPTETRLNFGPLDRILEKNLTLLLQQLDDAVRNNPKSQSTSIVARFGQLRHDPKGAFNCLPKYAVSEDAALPAEKYYRTIREEFEAAALEHRWDHVVSLARVTAREYG